MTNATAREILHLTPCASTSKFSILRYPIHSLSPIVLLFTPIDLRKVERRRGQRRNRAERSGAHVVRPEGEGYEK